MAELNAFTIVWTYFAHRNSDRSPVDEARRFVDIAFSPENRNWSLFSPDVGILLALQGRLITNL